MASRKKMAPPIPMEDEEEGEDNGSVPPLNTPPFSPPPFSPFPSGASKQQEVVSQKLGVLELKIKDHVRRRKT